MPLLALLTPRALFWAAILLILAGLGVQTTRLAWARTALATEQAERAKVEAERERAARMWQKKISSLQADHAAATVALADAYEQDRTRLADDAARAGADADELRRAVESFTAARSGSPAPDAAAVLDFKNRAATLGQLFREADSLAESMARAAERHASEVRSLKSQIMADRAACNPQP
jgi:hypothetical protein